MSGWQGTDAEPPTLARDAWLGWARGSGLPIRARRRRGGSDFLAELTRYCELVSGPGGAPIGLMIRGEDESFTARATALMRARGLPDDSVARFLEQSAFFEHKRAFLKVEWAAGPDGGGAERLVAYYHRRRPSVAVAQQRYLGFGSRPRRSSASASSPGCWALVHSLRRGGDAPRTSAAPQALLLPVRDAGDDGGGRPADRGAMNLAGIDPVTAAAQLEQHARMLPAVEACTIFVSMKFTDQGLLPGMKIDYPQVTLDWLATCAAGGDRATTLATGRSLCAAAGTSALSFVGVALSPRRAPALKLMPTCQARGCRAPCSIARRSYSRDTVSAAGPDGRATDDAGRRCRGGATRRKGPSRGHTAARCARASSASGSRATSRG